MHIHIRILAIAKGLIPTNANTGEPAQINIMNYYIYEWKLKKKYMVAAIGH